MTYYPVVDDDITTVAPARRRVGHEIELSSGGAVGFSTMLRQRELCPEAVSSWGGDPSLLHPASCRCDESDNFPIHPQHDSSSRGGEYVLGGKSGVLYGSDAYLEAVNLTCRLATEQGMGISYAVGSHIHTSNEGIDDDSHNLLFANYLVLEDDLLRLATCEMDRFRANTHVAGRLRTSSGWAGRIQPGGNTIIVGRGGKSTYEFRIWNASLVPQTLITNAGVCVAMVEAAIAGEIIEPGTSLVEGLALWLTDEVIADAERRIGEDKEIPPPIDVPVPRSGNMPLCGFRNCTESSCQV